jgi:hypothetical protein
MIGKPTILRFRVCASKMRSRPVLVTNSEKEAHRTFTRLCDRGRASIWMYLGAGRHIRTRCHA